MGDSYGESGAQSPTSNLNRYGNVLPSYSQLAGETVPGITEQNLIAANEMVNPTDPSVIAKQQLDRAQAAYDSNPNRQGTAQALQAAKNNYENAKNTTRPLGYNELNLQQMEKYGVPLAQAGQDIQRSNALAGSDIVAKQLEGPGAEAAGAATAITRALNPALASANDGAAAVIKNINLNGLSPGESNATERALNQYNTGTGNMGLVNPTNILANAMNFGGAYNNKLNVMNNAVASATNAGNAMTSSVNPTNVAMAQPSPTTASNFGSGQFANTNPTSTVSSSGNAFNFANSLFGSMTSGNNAAQSAGASMANATSPAAYLGAVCCFIFLEAYKGKLPKCVRRGRDGYYNANPFIATGYRRVASWLVPLMQENEFIRQLVWLTMVKPITEHLSHPKKGWRKSLTHCWLRVWAVLGRGKWECEYANPMVKYV